ncbi:MAG: MFS transporter [Caulobacteraceae bacterium]|nr:MFS transporter [Caulobacteraceae bacterium]
MTSASAAPASDRLSFPGLVAFSMPGLPIGALAIAMAVFLPKYYAGHFGLGLAVVGGAFGAVRLIDMTFDPFIGVMMDHTTTRFGRYRPWLLLGAPVLMLSVYMLFTPPTQPTYAWLIGWLFVYYIGTSLITLAHSSWASVIASHYHERSRVFGMIQVVSVIGATAVLILPVAMERGAHAHSAAVPGMGWFVFVAAPFGVLLALSRTPERIVRHRDGDRVTPRDYWEMIARPDMRRIIVADFCLAMGPGWMSALYLFYFRESRGFTIAQASLLLLLYVFAGVFGAGVLSRLAMKFGKHRTLMVASTGYSLGLIGLAMLPKGSMLLVAPFMFVMGFLATSFVLLDRAMVADVGDAILLETGKHRVGLLYAMITTVQKIAGALSIFLSFAVLAAIGYDAKDGVINTPAAIHGLELVYLIGPVVFVMLGGACYIGYKLDHKAHARIREALDLRDSMQPEPAIIESLSGSQSIPNRLPEPGIG